MGIRLPLSCAIGLLSGCAKTLDVPPEGDCEEGEFRCVQEPETEGAFEQCACGDDGCSFVLAGSCEGACDLEDQRCQSNVCSGGVVERCSANGAIERCDAQVGGWLAPTPCEEGLVCDPEMGASCSPRLCVPQSRYCADAQTAVQCNELGSQVEILETCKGFARCSDAMCEDPCDIAVADRSFVGCLYYGVDLNNEDPYDGLDYDLVVGNADPEQTATVTVSRRSCSTKEWAVISMGTATLKPGDAHAFILEDTHVEDTGLAECGAYRIDSNIPIVAYQFNASIEAMGGTFSSNASVLYPKSALSGCKGSSSYYVMSSASTGSNGSSGLTVVGTEENSHVVLRVTADVTGGTGVSPLAAGESEVFPLNEGDVLALSSTAGDLTGTFIEGDQPIAVFGHHERACTEGGICADSVGSDGVEEQMMPLSTWGRRFVAAPLTNPVSSYFSVPTLWKLIAAEAETTISFDPQADCEGIPEKMVIQEEGGFAEIMASNASAANPCEFLIEADKPIFVVQFSLWDSYDSGDPAMVTVVPVEQWPPRYTFLAPDYFIDRVRLVREAGSDVFLNGAAVEGSWSVIGVDGDYESIGILEGAGFINGPNVLEVVCAGAKSQCGVALSVEGDGGGCHYGYIGGLSLACIYAPPE